MHNIRKTFRYIRSLPLAVSYQQVEEWVMEYEKQTARKPVKWWNRLFKRRIKTQRHKDF